MTATEVVCGGFCKSTFHYKCAMISEVLYKEVAGNSATFWMCKACREIMGNARFKNTLVSMNAATKEVSDVYQKLVNDLKTEVKSSLIAELRQEIQGGFNKLSPMIQSPGPNRFQFINRPTPKRTRERDEFVFPVSEQPSKVFRGTNQSTSTPMGPIDTSENKFWIYLTKISPEATENDIVNLAKNCLQTEDVVAKALVPRGRPISTLTFLSFKVGVSQAVKSRAMDPSTWPSEIQFREFVDTSSSVRHFWKPDHRTDPGALNNPELQSVLVPSTTQNQQ